MPENPREIFTFGPFRLDAGERLLWRGGAPVALQPKAFDTLVLLVRRAGQLVRKDEMLRELWPDTHVSEANLTQNVWLLRRALGEEEGGPVYLETVPKAGYRFVAPVSRDATPALAAAIAIDPPPAAGPPRPLRGVLLIVVLLAFALAAFYPLRQRVRAVAAREELAAPAIQAPRRSIAGLELANLSGDPEVAWLATALPEMLAAEIAASGEVRTLPGEAVARVERDLSRPSSLQGEELRRVGARLGVDYLLTGSYLVTGGLSPRRQERQVRVDLQLIDARSGGTLATISDTRGESSLLALASDAGKGLRRSLGLEPLTAAETNAWLAALPRDSAARSLYFEGLRRLRSLDALAARDLLERAIAREPEFPLAHAALASAWTTLGYDSKAQDAAKAAAERSGSLPREGRLLVEANFHRAMSHWDEAVERFQALFTFYPDEIEYGLRLASTLSFAGRGEEALKVIPRLRELPPQLSGDPRIDLAEAQAAQALGDLKRAVAASSAAIDKGRRQGARGLVAGALAFKGAALRELGEPVPARAALEEALALARAAGDRNEEARDIHSLGHIVRGEGDLAKAETMYRHAMQIALEVGNRRSASTALGSLANLSLERGELKEALESYRRVVALKREIGDRKGEGINLYNLAHAHLALGEMAEAERRFQEALAVRREVGETIGIANSLQGLAMTRMARGELRSVQGLLEEAARISMEVGDQEFLGSTLNAWGDLRLMQGDVAGALEKHQESLRIRRQARIESGIAESLSSVAEDLRELGRLEEAATMAAQAIEGFRRTEHPDGEAMARVTLVACRVAQGRIAEARRMLAPLRGPAARQNLEARLQIGLAAADLEAAGGGRRQAAEILARTLREAGGAGLLPYVYEARLARARLELGQGDSAAVRASLAMLARDAEARGLGLIAGKARTLQAR
jgi:eukaryotic-like serine/threonine-protein kinase